MAVLIIGSIVFALGMNWGGLIQQEEVLKLKTVKKASELK